MPVHSQENDIQGCFEVGKVLIPEDMEKVVQDVLQHDGTVKVLLAGYQDLGLIRVTSNLEKKRPKTLKKIKKTNKDNNN